jgi:hypothetical protein
MRPFEKHLVTSTAFLLAAIQCFVFSTQTVPFNYPMQSIRRRSVSFILFIVPCFAVSAEFDRYESPYTICLLAPIEAILLLHYAPHITRRSASAMFLELLPLA